MDNKRRSRIIDMSSGLRGAGQPELRELFEERTAAADGAPISFCEENRVRHRGEPYGENQEVLLSSWTPSSIGLRPHGPDRHITLRPMPVKLRSDGTFTMLFALPDSPADIRRGGNSSDGVEERTMSWPWSGTPNDNIPH